MLLALLLIPLISGIFCTVVPVGAKSITYAGLLLSSILVVLLGQQLMLSSWFLEEQSPWIPSWSASFHLALDSFSYWLILLTLVLSFCAVFICQKSSGYFAALNWAIFGVIGLFLSANTLLF